MSHLVKRLISFSLKPTDFLNNEIVDMDQKHLRTKHLTIYLNVHIGIHDYQVERSEISFGDPILIPTRN